jgi:glycosyltransferase involved in cell wall biosynthesis
MKSEPLVSILIPNYNYERTIAEAIESAIGQTYANKEIIVLDNRSTDQSYKIAKRYRKYGVKVHRNRKNMGVESHNLLINLSRGEYIHILHSDDSIEPTFIEECVCLMERYPNVGFTVTERQEMDADSNFIETAPPFYNTSCIIPAQSQRCVILMASYYIPSETVFRRSVVEQVGRYEVDITNFMDWWLLYKCSCISDMGCINKPLCRYRIWGKSETSYMTKNMIMPLNGFLIRAKMLDFARAENDERMLEREAAAVLKQADLTVKLGVDVIREGMLQLGRKYLSLAEAYSFHIKSTPLYQATDEYLQKPDLQQKQDIDSFLIGQGLFGKRNQSYDPPEDYIPYLS